MDTVVCSRCQDSKEQLAQAPVGGKLGEAILARICQDCWLEWQQVSAQLINHYGLNLGVPEHRGQLRQAMREFLNLTEA